MKLALMPGVGSDDLCMSLLTQPLLGFGDEVKGILVWAGLFIYFFIFSQKEKSKFYKSVITRFSCRRI